ncbi:hypothetical protein KUCAC02_001231, partial [Chaenocephalus aceratus]
THYTPWKRTRTVPETITASPGVFSVQKNKERILACCTKHTPPQDINTGKDPETKHAAETLELSRGLAVSAHVSHPIIELRGRQPSQEAPGPRPSLDPRPRVTEHLGSAGPAQPP